MIDRVSSVIVFAVLWLLQPVQDLPESARRASDEGRSWMLGPFAKQDTVNPVLVPFAGSTFQCPVRVTPVHWEQAFVFNPAAVVRDRRVYLLYRAEDRFAGNRGTSRIGLAWSSDGYHFDRSAAPVLFPDSDAMLRYEWDGGCEDPRIVEDSTGRYIITYTSWNRECARLCIASSHDLVHWKKHGPAFRDAYGGRYLDTWSKSGSVIAEVRGGRLVAKMIHGKYWMYWGESDIFLASSPDLLHWTPIEMGDGVVSDDRRFTARGKERLLRVLTTRRGKFDSGLVEPGPPAILTRNGIVFIYNSRNTEDPDIPVGTYSAGQALLDPDDPSKVLDRSSSSFIRPEHEYELRGQVNNVCFVEGLAFFRGNILLYYGTADSRIAVAVSAPGN